MKTIQNEEQHILDELNFFDSWEERYSYLIELGKKLPAFPEQWKTDPYKIDGCQSQVWLHHRLENDDEKTLHFFATSDALIVSGLIALLLRLYHKRTPQNILGHQPRWIDEGGFSSHLSPTRQNGLSSMIKRIFALANLYKNS